MSIENYEVFTLDDLEDTDCSAIVNDTVEDLSAEDDVVHDSVLRFTEMAEQVSLDDFAQIEIFDDDNTALGTEFELSEKLDLPIEETEFRGNMYTSVSDNTDMLNTETNVVDTIETLETDVEETVTSVTHDVVYRQGMTIVEFLRENPAIRSKTELCKYFATENVNRAIHNGAIMCMHDKICL